KWIQVGVSFSDLGLRDWHKVEAQFADGSTTIYFPSQPNPLPPSQHSFAFSTPLFNSDGESLFPIWVTVSDDDSGSDSASVDSPFSSSGVQMSVIDAYVSESRAPGNVSVDVEICFY